MILEFLFLKLTKENPPELNKDKCINSYKKNMECNICKDYCRAHAVRMKDNSVVFDGKLCNNCGICKAKCPTQAIRIKGSGEIDILNNASEKENLVFSCSMEGTIGNINLSCLNALHPEFISALFILHKEKKFHFNLSKCTKCEFGYKDSLFRDALNKAVTFTNALGIYPDYEIHTEEKDLPNLLNEEISRRDLFKLVKKGSGKIALKTINTIIDDDDNQLSNRSILLKSIKIENLELGKNYTNIFWEYWDVSTNCDGCGKCTSVCPGRAWKIENTDTKIKLYHSIGNCYKCGLCETVCPKKAITKGIIEAVDLLEFKLKREINLSTCKICNKKFISDNQDNEECDICKKKELLRRKISTSV
ncbi:MAG: 4Fe-4S dicluster domain-containing protein [Sedimentibacter sp.]